MLWSANIIYSKVNNEIFVYPVDSLYTLLTCQSLNHQQLLLFRTTLNIGWLYSATFSLIIVSDDPGLNNFIFTIIKLAKQYNCNWFNLFWNFALLCCILFWTFFSLVFIDVNVVVVVVLLYKVRLISFYSQKWYTWWWNNCEMKE